MKLQELVSGLEQRKKLKNSYRHDALLYLYKLGFEHLDNGWYATILVHPRVNYVIKLFDNNDEGYAEFIQVVQQHKDNPHFPRFQGQPMNFGQWTALRMERLQPYQSDFKKLWQLLDAAMYYSNWRADVKDTEFLEHWPKFGLALDILNDAIRGKQIQFDWNRGNIMQRSDGTPVIVDAFKNPI